MNERGIPSARVYVTRRLVMPLSWGVGLANFVMARDVDVQLASPSAAPFNGFCASVRAKKLGGSIGDSRLVINVPVAGFSQATKYSKLSRSERKSRSVLKVRKFNRSRKGRSPSGEGQMPRSYIQ